MLFRLERISALNAASVYSILCMLPLWLFGTAPAGPGRFLLAQPFLAVKAGILKEEGNGVYRLWSKVPAEP